MTKKQWKMPDWMEPYRGSFAHTGTNTIEDLLNDKLSDLFNNPRFAAQAIAAESQVILLSRLHAAGKL